MKFKIIVEDEDGNCGWANGEMPVEHLQNPPSEAFANVRDANLVTAFYAAVHVYNESRKPVTAETEPPAHWPEWMKDEWRTNRDFMLGDSWPTSVSKRPSH